MIDEDNYLLIWIGKVKKKGLNIYLVMEIIIFLEGVRIDLI